MDDLHAVAPEFVAMAHRIVWCTAATVDTTGRPRTRILHPIWEWDGTALTGWIATSPQSPKRAHLDANPTMSLTYWDATQDTCTADCDVAWVEGDEARAALWERFAQGPAPVGYDPRLIPQWTSPQAEAFGGVVLTPRSLRLMPGSVMMAGQGRLLTWSA